MEESHWSVKSALKKRNITIDKTFVLDEIDFLAEVSLIPFFVKNEEMVGTIKCVKTKYLFMIIQKTRYIPLRIPKSLASCLDVKPKSLNKICSWICIENK